jgi:hypothetical protein
MIFIRGQSLSKPIKRCKHNGKNVEGKLAFKDIPV